MLGTGEELDEDGKLAEVEIVLWDEIMKMIDEIDDRNPAHGYQEICATLRSYLEISEMRGGLDVLSEWSTLTGMPTRDSALLRAMSDFTGHPVEKIWHQFCVRLRASYVAAVEAALAAQKAQQFRAGGSGTSIPPVVPERLTVKYVLDVGFADPGIWEVWLADWGTGRARRRLEEIGELARATRATDVQTLVLDEYSGPSFLSWNRLPEDAQVGTALVVGSDRDGRNMCSLTIDNGVLVGTREALGRMPWQPRLRLMTLWKAGWRDRNRG